MAITAGYVDPSKLREYFEDARDVVQSEVIKINRETPSFWSDWMPMGTFQLGKGYVQQQKYYEQSYIEAHSKWRDVAASIAAGDGCALAPEIIVYGSTFTNFSMEELEVRGPSVCLKEIPDMQDFSEELQRQYTELARVGRFKFENRYRDTHILFSKKKFLGMADGIGGLPYHEAAFPSPDGATVGIADQTMLDWVATQMDAEGGWQENMGVRDGAPFYFAIMSGEASDTILRNNDADRDDIRRSSMQDELLKKWHANLYYKRFVHIIDVQAPRFTWEATAGFTRVPYFTEEVTTIGQRAIANPAYQEAPYEIIQIIANRMGPEALTMPQISSPGGNTQFNQIHNRFNFEFINYGDNANNPVRNHGYFLGTAMEAINPRQNRFVHNIMVARNLKSIIITAPTPDSGSVPAATGLNNWKSVDQCGLIPVEACANYQAFTCTDVGPNTTTKDNTIWISPIRVGTVVDTDTVKLAGAGDIVFTVYGPIGTPLDDPTSGVLNGMVQLGYDGDPITCAQLVKDWKLTDATTGLDVEDDPAE